MPGVADGKCVLGARCGCGALCMNDTYGEAPLDVCLEYDTDNPSAD